MGSFVLLLVFTGYIALMYRTSDNLPSSCGGILEKMSWHQHMYFNISRVILSIVTLGLDLKYSMPAD